MPELTAEWEDYLFGDGPKPTTSRKKSTGRTRTKKAVKPTEIVRYLHLWTRSKYHSIARIKAIASSRGWTVLSPGTDAVKISDNKHRLWTYYKHEQFGVIYRETPPTAECPGPRESYCDCCQRGVSPDHITYYDINALRSPVMRYGICKDCIEADVLRSRKFSASKEKNY